MKIVIDSNRIAASLLKDSTTREILCNRHFQFAAPEFLKEEILKHRMEFIRRAKIKSEEFDILLSLLFERVALVPKKEYIKYFGRLGAVISDSKDIPYIACCLAIKAEGVWSHDPHFLKQVKVKIFTNKDLLDMI